MRVKTQIGMMLIVHSDSLIIANKSDYVLVDYTSADDPNTYSDNDYTLNATFKFIDNDVSGKQRVSTGLGAGLRFVITCENFNNPDGTGMAKPILVSTNMRGKGLYMMFWIYKLSDNAKKLEYQLMLEA